MKNIVLCLFAIVLTTLAANARSTKTEKPSRFYLRAGIGYAFPHAGQLTLQEIGISGSINANINTSSSLTDYSLKKASFGSGVNAIVAAGYEVHPNVCIELGFGSVLAGRKYKFDETDLYSATGEEDTYHNQLHAKPGLWCMPALVLQTSNSKTKLYSRVGIVLPLINKIAIEESRVSSLTSSYSAKSELTSRLGIGFEGALGVRVNVGRKVDLWVEANGISMNTYAKKLVLKSFVQNGQNVLSQIPAGEREVKYEFNYSENSQVNSRVQGTFAVPYSNIGLALGLSFAL